MKRKDFIKSLTGLALIPVVGKSEELHNELFVYGNDGCSPEMLKKIRDYEGYKTSDCIYVEDDDDSELIVLYNERYEEAY